MADFSVSSRIWQAGSIFPHGACVNSQKAACSAKGHEAMPYGIPSKPIFTSYVQRQGI